MPNIRVQSRCFDQATFPALYAMSDSVAAPPIRCSNCLAGPRCRRGILIVDVPLADVIQAAVTFGKAPHFAVTQQGASFIFERQYRIAVIRASLEQAAGQLVRSAAFQRFERTEKAFASFFLGMTAATVFARRFLNVAGLLHLDMYGATYLGQYGALNSTLVAAGQPPSNRRPDLIGPSFAANPAAPKWVIAEAKGRVAPWDRATREAAREQAEAIVDVGGVVPWIRVATCAYFDRDSIWCFEWQDPEEPEENEQRGDQVRFSLATDPDEFLRLYYAPFLSIFAADLSGLTRTIVEDREFVAVPLPDVDVSLEIDAALLDRLRSQDYAAVAALLHNYASDTNFQRPPGLGIDGIYTRLGSSWPIDREAQVPSQPRLFDH